MSELSRRFRSRPLWGLKLAPAQSVRGRVIEARWRWPTVLALCATIPAFYVELLRAAPPLLAGLAYMLAAMITTLALLHTSIRCGHPREHLLSNPLDILLVLGLLLAAALPPSSGSMAGLVLRLGVAFLTLVRMMWAMQHLITRGGLAYMLLIAVVILGACGAGFWLLEPRTPSFTDGLWLAFTTAATVGFGDVVPSTPASKIFSVFVVLLGYGVLSLVTAAIATNWVETEERIIEREILRDMHRQMDTLRLEVVELRRELKLARLRDEKPFLADAGPPPNGSERQPM